MSIIIDVIILAILALCIGFGYYKGLTGSLLKIVSFVLAIVVAFVLFKPVSNFIIEKTDWDDNLEQSIRDAILTEKNETKVETTKDENQSMPTIMVDYINKAVEDAGNNAKETIVDATARDVAVTIVNAGVWVGLFLVARIILFFIKGLANLITDLPIIKQVDKTGGIIYGAIEALVIIYILLAVVSFISPLVSGTGIIEAMQKSYIGSIMYNNNLLLKLIF